MAGFAQNYFAGRQAALDEQATRQKLASNALAMQSAQRLNALSSDPNATPEQYIRAGDAQTGNALAGYQQTQQANQAQAITQIATLARQAADIAQTQGVPASKAFTQQAVSMYGDHFKALGVDLTQGLSQLQSLPDDQYLQGVQRAAALAPPEKPIQVSAGGSLVNPRTYQPLYTAPNPSQEETARHNRAMEGIAQQKAAGNADQAGYDPETLKTAALVVASDPTRMRDYASFGQSGQNARIAINKAITQLKKDTGMSDADFVRARVAAKAATANLTTLTKQQSQVAAAEELAHANGDRLLQLFDLVDQTGIPLIEGFTRSARAKAGGVDAAELRSVLTAFQTEVARILSGNPNMTGVVSDSLRQEIQHMAPGNMSTDQAKRIINRLYTEMAIRQNAINDQITKSGNAAVVGGQPTPAPAPSPTASATGPVRVNTPQEAMALPSGTQFITPDGRMKVRP